MTSRTTNAAEPSGLWGAITAVAGVIGAPLAGLLIDVGSWRASFIVFATLAAAVAAAACSAPKEQRTLVAATPLDLLGAATIVIGLGLLVLALVEGNNWGWTSARTLLVAAAALVLIGLAVQRSRGQADPVIPLDLLGERNMALACGLSLTTAIGFFAHWLVVLTLLTDLWNLTLLSAALTACVMPLTMAVIAVPAGRAIDRFDFRHVMVPGALVYASLFGVAALLLDTDQNWWVLGPALVGAGIGMGSVWPPLTGAGTSRVAPERLATATALIHTFQRVGGALGSAIAVAWIASGTSGEVATYRDPMWMLVVVGVVAALGSAMFQRDRARSSL